MGTDTGFFFKLLARSMPIITPGSANFRILKKERKKVIFRLCFQQIQECPKHLSGKIDAIFWKNRVQFAD